MAVIRLRALEMLAKCLQNEIADLKGRICPGPTEPNKVLQFPSLSIQPTNFTYMPEQAREWRIPTFDTAVMEVGKHEVRVQLRLGAQTHRQRVILEDKILQVFMKQELRPGVLVQQIADCFDAVIAWELEEELWEDESIFDQKWYSIITILGQFPALVCRNSYTIEQLQLGLTDDFTTDFNSSTFDTSPLVEVVDINEDGTISPA